jgi:hypothetical protein
MKQYKNIVPTIQNTLNTSTHKVHITHNTHTLNICRNNLLAVRKNGAHKLKDIKQYFEISHGALERRSPQFGIHRVNIFTATC